VDLLHRCQLTHTNLISRNLLINTQGHIKFRGLQYLNVLTDDNLDQAYFKVSKSFLYNSNLFEQEIIIKFYNLYYKNQYTLPELQVHLP